MKRLLINALTTIPLVGALALIPTGCSDVEEAYDCARVCSRYEDCFDEDFDTTQCASDCEDMADESDAYAERVSNCEACIDDRSCSGSFACVDECAGVVP